ncbi:hypothetical protein KEM09_09570 [Carboxylicivirga mesophila]|uniref:YARHG domain-containing protein n=1 Tax=Carboxylicivirga mesophila TaxID=1166478 RepID=A0ABS5KAW8_9BACT|nr:hypothetical protein [Carboxylicivirga mesophila]MBS2211651.1 hypothetical protein [Carboxylicivirga mesophila]
MTKITGLLTAFLLGMNVVIAQVTDKPVFPSLFDNSEVLKVSLYFDITSHIRKKSEEYCDSKVIIYFSATDSAEINVRCRARGNYRKDNCFFPPVMLNFKPDTLFTEDGYLTKLKLVTHCSGSKVYEEYMLKEYLIYKLWALLSPYALRTRLCDIQYFDFGERGKNYQAKGFFLEPVYMMSERTNTIEIEGEYFKDHEINAMDADRVAFFNYMIGNTDWRIKSGHNVLFIKRFGHRREEVTAIPYDFDHAGFVNASYAKPAEWSSADDVTERDYTGRCRDYDDNYYALIGEFLAIEEQVYETILNFEHLDMRDRKQLYKYISNFYKQLKKPEAFIRSIHNSCMNRY